jgi:replicative DNA helicase
MPVSTSSSPPARGENLVDPSNTITTAKRQGRRERPQRATHTASVPPHDITAEESVLGAAMHTETALAILLDRTRAEDFYRPAHRTIHRAIRALHNQGQPVDPLTVKAALERDGALADIGGAPLLFDLYAVPPTVANAPAYAQTVVDHSLNRQLIDVGHQTIQAVYEGLGPAKTIRLVTDLLERVQASANGAAGTASGLDLDALLDLPLPEYDWLVEDLIERGDRIVLPRRKLSAGLDGGRLPRSDTVRISSYFRSIS